MSGITVVYALENPPAHYSESIFLAGPTPRSEGVESWRPEALAALERSGFSGVVYVPESRNGRWHGDWMAQVKWEEHRLAAADCILFWVPRDMATLPGLTTNVEWGVWQDSGKVVLGSPPSSQAMTYLSHYAHQHGVPVSSTLEQTVDNCIDLLTANRYDSCVFCQITGPDKRLQVEWRGRDSVVITPLGPVVPGHRLVIPRVHVSDAFEHPGVTARVMRDAAEYAHHTGIGNCNVITSIGSAATQTVFHLHVHLVPRKAGDELHLPWTNQHR